MIVRAATSADALALARIYGHAVLHGLGTFEEVPPAPAEMDARRAAIAERGLPYLVAEVATEVVGFAYAGPFRPRAAYRYTLEDSVYVDPAAQGRGVGRTLLSAVISACEALGVRQLVAVIGDSGNAASLGLHRALGFEPVGIARSVGFKHGRWVDIMQLQKPLNGGDATPPQGGGVRLG